MHGYCFTAAYLGAFSALDSIRFHLANKKKIKSQHNKICDTELSWPFDGPVT